jgi:hypothetical protein
VASRTESLVATVDATACRRRIVWAMTPARKDETMTPTKRPTYPHVTQFETRRLERLALRRLLAERLEAQRLVTPSVGIGRVRRKLADQPY